MHIWGKGRAAGRVGSGQTFCRQSRVGLGRVNVSPGRVGSGPRKVTRGQHSAMYYCLQMKEVLRYLFQQAFKTSISAMGLYSLIHRILIYAYRLSARVQPLKGVRTPNILVDPQFWTKLLIGGRLYSFVWNEPPPRPFPCSFSGFAFDSGIALKYRALHALYSSFARFGRPTLKRGCTLAWVNYSFTLRNIDSFAVQLENQSHVSMCGCLYLKICQGNPALNE